MPGNRDFLVWSSPKRMKSFSVYACRLAHAKQAVALGSVSSDPHDSVAEVLVIIGTDNPPNDVLPKMPRKSMLALSSAWQQ